MNTCSDLTKGSSVTFESVGEILCYSHSNETLSAVLWRGTIYFFTIRENCVLEKFWHYLGAQWLKLNSEMKKNKYMRRRQAVRRKNIRKISSLDTQKEFYLQFWENSLYIVNVRRSPQIHVVFNKELVKPCSTGVKNVMHLFVSIREFNQKRLENVN